MKVSFGYGQWRETYCDSDGVNITLEQQDEKEDALIEDAYVYVHNHICLPGRLPWE